MFSCEIIPRPVTPKNNAKILFLRNEEKKTTPEVKEILEAAFNILVIRAC